MSKYCDSTIKADTKYIIKQHQLSVANFLYKHHGMIAVHDVGTGKTLSAVATAQCLLLNDIVKRVIVVTPTSLQENFKKQMRAYNRNIDVSKYSFYTLQGLCNAIYNRESVSCRGALVIVDEAHNLRTIGSARADIIIPYLKSSSKVLLLTATPIINYETDIINLIAMARNEKPIAISDFIKMYTATDQVPFKKYLSNVFHFYSKSQSDPNGDFPSKTVKEVFLTMKKDYLQKYLIIESSIRTKIPGFNNKDVQAFYNGVRRASNIIDNLSPKVDWIKSTIFSELAVDPKTKFVIFSNFISAGIKPIIKILEERKVSYGSITGSDTSEQRGKLVNLYNSNKINVLFISKAGAEGLDLKGTNFIIVLESNWNENIVEQIIGRGVRFRSHAHLPPKKRKVIVYKLLSIKPKEEKNLKVLIKNSSLILDNDPLSVDLYLRNYAARKQKIITEFYKTLKKYKI